jgi:hypothetical protein
VNGNHQQQRWRRERQQENRDQRQYQSDDDCFLKPTVEFTIHHPSS